MSSYTQSYPPASHLPGRSYARSAAGIRSGSASLVMRVLMFALGLTLPMISFSTQRGLSTRLVDRIAIVDLVCLLVVAILTFDRRLRLRPAHLLYLLALFIACGLGMAVAPGLSTITGLAALGMAFLYIVLGESIADSPSLVRAMLAGLVVGIAGESVVVLHDFFLPSWFPDRHPDRVRGTFKASGQLAQFGFAASGILLACGWVFFRRPRWQYAIAVAGILAAFFVVAASRRSGMFALAAWCGCYLLLGLQSSSRKAYAVVFASTLLAVLLLPLAWAPLANTYVGERLQAAVTGLSSGQSFIIQQYLTVMSNMDVWFPLGTGIGQGHLALVEDGLPVRAEVHNGHLAILTELGVLGLIAFYLLMARVVTCRFQGPLSKHGKAIRASALALVLASAVFMVHNRLHRDRTFGLLLGLVPGMAAASAARADPSRASGSLRK